MILLKMSSLTPSLMIRVAVPTAIRFSLIFFSRSHKATRSSRGPTLMRSHTSFSMSIAFVRSDHRGQFAKLLSFCWRELPEVLSVYSLVMVGEGTKGFVPRGKFVFFWCSFSRGCGSAVSVANRVL